MTLQPSPPHVFVSGPALAPTDRLRAWLQTNAGRRVRLPLTVDSSVLGVQGGFVGEGGVQVDDSALGVALFDRARAACGGAPRCALWVEGVVIDDAGAAPTLRVLQVDGAVGDDGDHVEVEAIR